MAQIVFITKGIVYDTCRQTAQMHQLVERLSLGDGSYEKCVVTNIAYAPESGYNYTLIGLKTFLTFTTRFVFDECSTASGVYADLEFPSFLTADQLVDIVTRAASAEQIRRQPATSCDHLHRSAVIVDYSARSFAIFTDEPGDAIVLERIRAKRNSSLTYHGRKVAGWVFPKYRQAELSAVTIVS